MSKKMGLTELTKTEMSRVRGGCHVVVDDEGGSCWCYCGGPSSSEDNGGANYSGGLNSPECGHGCAI